MKEFTNNVLVGYIKAFVYIFGLPLILVLLAVLFPMWMSFMTIIIISALYIPIAAFFTIYLFLAPQAICFIFALENVAILIERGGRVVGTVYASSIYDVENFKVIPKKYKESWLKTKLGGLTFYGITPNKDVHFLTLIHNKLIENEIEDGGRMKKKYNIMRTEKRTSRIDLRKMNYAMFFSEMETKDRISIYAVTSVTLRVIDIYAFVEHRNIYGRLEERLLSEFRDFIRNYGYDEIIGEKAVGNLGEIFYTRLKENHIIEEINRMGFETYSFMLLDINLQDRAAEEASRSIYLAEKEKTVKVLKAEGDAAGLEKIIEVCRKYDIPPALVMLIQKIGPDQANYLFWQGNFLQETMQKLDKNVVVDEMLKKNVKGFLDSLTKNNP